jgi:hypothetical protein
MAKPQDIFLRVEGSRRFIKIFRNGRYAEKDEQSYEPRRINVTSASNWSLPVERNFFRVITARRDAHEEWI